MLHIFVDADACPVKTEICKVARRYGLSVTLVANDWMRVPDFPRVSLQVVKDGLDVADDWIVDQVGAGDLVITADIPLADRCLKKGASVLGPTGRAFTEDNIGDVLATRDLMEDLRSAGQRTGGPPPIQKQDRSRFLQKADEIIQRIRRQNPG